MVTKPQQPTRIMIVDDHDQVRDGLATFLHAFDDMELVGSASNGADAIQMSVDTEPDVILMDLAMPRMSGLDAAQAIGEVYPQAAIIILTGHIHKNLAAEAKRAGAVAYLNKGITAGELAHAIRTATPRNRSS